MCAGPVAAAVPASFNVDLIGDAGLTALLAALQHDPAVKCLGCVRGQWQAAAVRVCC